jgi:Ca-activated chloride channel family protein
VFPIGFGTRNPTNLVCTPAQLAGQGFDGFGGPGGPGGAGGGRSFLVADEPTLQEVAETTGGEYFSADDAGRLQDVLADLPRTVESQRQDVEVTVGLVGLATVLLLGSLWAAARWTAFPA